MAPKFVKQNINSLENGAIFRFYSYLHFVSMDFKSLG
jgi:hypothetical protein